MATLNTPGTFVHDLLLRSGVADAAVPDAVLVLKFDGNVDLDLVVHSEALLVNNVRFIARRAVCIHRRREHNFVFGSEMRYLLGRLASQARSQAPNGTPG